MSLRCAGDTCNAYSWAEPDGPSYVPTALSDMPAALVDHLPTTPGRTWVKDYCGWTEEGPAAMRALPPEE